MSAPPATVPPLLECGACQTRLPVEGKRVGDSVQCGCGRLEVITRLKIKEGSLPPAKIMGRLEPKERKEVDQALQRIKMRRVGHAARNVEVYPTWALVLSIGQFWLTGVLASHNLGVTGQPQRGRRIAIAGGVLYVLLNMALLALGVAFWTRLSPIWLAPLVAVPVGFGVYAVGAQAKSARAARDAGAKSASPWVPFLLGVIVAIAQAFAALFLTSGLSTGF